MKAYAIFGPPGTGKTTEIKEGDWISLNGTTGEVGVCTDPPLPRSSVCDVIHN